MPPERMPIHRRSALAWALFLAGCAGAPAEGDGSPESARDYVPIVPEAPSPIGKFLADQDGRILAWSNLALTAGTDQERAQARSLEAILQRDTRQRIDELIAELEIGPPRNRQRAAAALGFTRDARAQSPLLAALEDPNPNVVHNALLGLALLSLPDTPTDRIVALLEAHPDPETRRHAAYALRSIVEAGDSARTVIEAGRLALLDTDAGVRSQAALLVGLAADGESVARLSDLARRDEPLVRSAAVEALVLIGRTDLPAKGRCARGLYAAWIEADSPAREQLHQAMARLAQEDLGDEEERWRKWANNLP